MNDSKNSPVTFGNCEQGTVYEDRNAAYAVIIHSGKVALVRNARGLYFLPGGGAEEGETPEQTVLREIREELGCEGIIRHSLGEAKQYFFAASDDKHYRMQAAFFRVNLPNVSEGAATSGEEPWCWLPPEEAKGRLFHACHTWAIEQVLRT